MIAFLKRSWMWISCGLGLLAAMCIDATWLSRSGSTLISLDEGSVSYWHSADYARYPRWIYPHRLHAPRFDPSPSFSSNKTRTRIRIPLWLPLSAIIGWIIIRELRLQKKCARSAEA